VEEIGTRAPEVISPNLKGLRGSNPNSRALWLDLMGTDTLYPMIRHGRDLSQQREHLSQEYQQKVLEPFGGGSRRHLSNRHLGGLYNPKAPPFGGASFGNR
jgi:hypothetical protein